MPYIANTPENVQEMLARIGVKNFNELIADIPQDILLKSQLDLPAPLSEMEAAREITGISKINRPAGEMISFLGGGAYDHYIPAAVDHILSRPEFYTAYTPYQAEVSQGTLQAIWEFQSLIAALTGMEVANASMYDGATALTEAGLMACSHTKRKKLIISGTVHPEYLEVLKTYCRGLNIEIAEIPWKDGVTSLEELERTIDDKTAAVLVQHPNFLGALEPVEEMSDIAHRKGALLVVSADPISLGILKAPGSYGADIATGEGQPLGIPLGLGGPYLGLLAAKNSLLRLMPGRIVGLTTDSQGREGLVLTMQAREQHIRREKASSNICSNQALCALAATVYLSLMGRDGIKQAAELCLQKSHYLAEQLGPAFKAPFFKEFVYKTNRPASQVLAELRQKGILAGLDLGRFFKQLEGHLLISVTEKRTKDELDLLIRELSK
ncbi:MAG: glycine dehydrogenase (aminomethyl-transferring) [Candidatus Edwardsbacteria bacterium RIFOXYD12_FULL_50_11]|uniref:Probable glycine dehydrogenase (decarboxylating) subunit 1 n=1 Tax=Candidatus Edwardsbacteria bacterium GWF2_54_11 TaxID=1817851 RepID=A0A1F5RH87_9BACT|nr:MAG: glycine dehydrogenase (aminomethyl-transferring) [Candidatus Edwardsbacteria bacterium RifOxyC12_full_54_24]OGF06114.1 MAG: glycine dehydrogenase (aminomethyl-transferring) [Candidatus Edwardsbacteria bacterium RifOxyA12_full_54_48]OGF12619.1 MAG: glycine dehydrogenase (aminomethyl-transferring) [Candidatus Edwardsbacteria bacterium GWE2_54_12]OGF13845.1 MAG: glycine dehydrogenase (aminomethyl-transferring) [Candidatus Edwardsbacteria bacterium GWF2_54_11]OGF17828.1 MAG: glycine dehydro